MTDSGISLWMGDLEYYMDEAFVTSAFAHYGERVVGVRCYGNRPTAQGYRAVGYCFVQFPDSTKAKNALMKLNGKPVPNTNPSKRFKLNVASRGHESTEDYSLFVGDLSEYVDDYQLYEAFSRRYKSCRSVKVVRNIDGASRGFAFVRFSDEYELQKAIDEMHNSTEFGRTPMKVRKAVPLKERNDGSGRRDPANYDQQQSYQYNMWWQQNASTSQYNSQQYAYGGGQHDSQATQQGYDMTAAYDDEELEDPEVKDDVDKMNREYMERSEELYEALEESRWYPVETTSSVALFT